MKILIIILIAFILLGSGIIVLFSELTKPTKEYKFDLTNYKTIKGEHVKKETLICKKSNKLIKITAPLSHLKNDKGDTLIFYKNKNNSFILNEEIFICEPMK